MVFLINVVLQKNTGKSLYKGLNYNYVCALYITFFSKVICLSEGYKKYMKTCEHFLKRNNLNDVLICRKEEYEIREKKEIKIKVI